MKELVDFSGTRGGDVSFRDCGPIDAAQDLNDAYGIAIQPALGQIRLQAEFAEQLQFERENILRSRRMTGEPIQKAAKQFEHRLQRCLGLGGLLEQSNAIGGLAQISQLTAQSRMRIQQADFAQCMQFGAAAAAETEISVVEQVEFAAKWGFGTASSFCHGRQASKLRRKPVDDQARLGQRSGAQDQARGLLNHGRYPLISPALPWAGAPGLASSPAGSTRD